jgi:methyl-accepting chemotaxis protein
MKKTSIAMKLLAGVTILLAVVSAGIGSLSYSQAARAVHRQVEENAPQIAAYGATVVRGILDRHIAVASELAATPDIASMDWDRQRPVLEAAAKRLGYLVWVSSTCKETPYPDGSTASLGDRGYFKKAVEGRANVSDVLISRVTNSAVIIIVAPIRNAAGQVSGVLLSRLDATWLSEVSGRIKYGEKGFSYVIDGKGAYIAHENGTFVLEQRNLLEESKTKPGYAALAATYGEMIGGKTGYAEYDFEGDNLIVGYARFRHGMVHRRRNPPSRGAAAGGRDADEHTLPFIDALLRRNRAHLHAGPLNRASVESGGDDAEGHS